MLYLTVFVKFSTQNNSTTKGLENIVPDMEMNFGLYNNTGQMIVENASFIISKGVISIPFSLN